jgi:hypothetical protein
MQDREVLAELQPHVYDALQEREHTLQLQSAYNALLQEKIMGLSKLKEELLFERSTNQQFIIREKETESMLAIIQCEGMAWDSMRTIVQFSETHALEFSDSSLDCVVGAIMDASIL